MHPCLRRSARPGPRISRSQGLEVSTSRDPDTPLIPRTISNPPTAAIQRRNGRNWLPAERKAMKSLPERLASTDKQQEFTKLFRCNPYVADEPEVVRGLGLFLIAVVIRFINRHYSTLPPFPASMSQRERKVASASEYFLYALLFVQPLVGWGMLSAAVPCHVVWVAPSFPRTSPQHNAVRSVAQSPHDIGLPLVLDVPRTFCEMEPSAVWRRGGFVRTRSRLRGVRTSLPASARSYCQGCKGPAPRRVARKE